MGIFATTNSQPRELIPAGNYFGRCYQMIEIGTVKETILGVEKILHKVRIGWELPSELKVFKEENGPQPRVISKEFTLSMHEKAALRIVLKSWRGKDFTEEEAKSFDITKLIGVPCMINIIHKPSKTDPTKIYEEISGITGVPKEMVAAIPAQINKSFVLSYDDFDTQLFETLPDFIKDKMKTSAEYITLMQPEVIQLHEDNKQAPVRDAKGNVLEVEPIDDLPF
jgi:hypothetical protein